ncbi:hypothetical protein CKO51_25450 [Rhodopirellula sp. SM50]|nr:hypothetical protein [Rhodopirellula sp. SM50]PAY16659.1 hypothetical protein CKO51_25450 [Rhodopirellula sp. SM50]
MNGFIKLHRKILHSDVAADEGTFHTFAMIIMTCNWKRARFKGREILPGQMVFAWRTLPERLQGAMPKPIAIGTLRKRVGELVQIGAVKLESTPKYSILTVVNWEKYQGSMSKFDTQDPFSVSEIDTPSDTLADTLIDTDRRSKTKKEKHVDDSTVNKEKTLDKELASWMFREVQRVVPKAKAPNLETWINDIRLMRERDGHTRDEIRAVFRWANADSFWSKNILCPGKLRKQFPQLHARMGGGKTLAPTPRNDLAAEARRRRAEKKAKHGAGREAVA